MRTHVVLGIVPILLAVAGCDSARTTGSGQVLARVNGSEISVHQLNRAAAGLPSQTPEQRADLVEALVRRELAVQQAIAQKLERDPEIMLKLEEARRDILASAWAERVDGGRPPPDRGEAARYFAAHPGLFAERRQYRLQELVVADNEDRLQEAMAVATVARSLGEARSALKEKGIAFSERAGTRLAEQIPIEVVDRLVVTHAGHIVVHRFPRSVSVYEVQSAERLPVSWAKAEPVIQAHLLAVGRKQSLERALGRLRSEARIEYLTGAGKL